VSDRDVITRPPTPPGAPIFIACASTGCKLVYRLTDRTAAELLDGVILQGALALSSDEARLPDLAIFDSPEMELPIDIGHGAAMRPLRG
jgi:hypothetical protein